METACNRDCPSKTHYKQRRSEVAAWAIEGPLQECNEQAGMVAEDAKANNMWGHPFSKTGKWLAWRVCDRAWGCFLCTSPDARE